ncbi:MAG: serine/threonine protein kinase [Sandaracinaceae bacterium]|nr:serine/threonine protein kinase [Sandaracinaceae bacterium]
MEPGTVVLDRFVIDARAGAGGMGTVYRAHDRASGAPVAVKVVADTAPEAARFAQEARVLGELEHASIVRYVAHGADAEGRSCLVMEWLEGEDLASRLARGPLSIEETLELARRVAEALAHAHARGVVHRDIKPSNVFLRGHDPAGVKVLDFGIARVRAAGGLDATMLPITRTGVVIGTVGYMSPEQARGASDVDARTDVFALGCVLYECLTGKPAFAGPNAVAVLAKVLIEDAPRPRTMHREVPRDVDELVTRMLAKRAADRPPRRGGARARARVARHRRLRAHAERTRRGGRSRAAPRERGARARVRRRARAQDAARRRDRRGRGRRARPRAPRRRSRVARGGRRAGPARRVWGRLHRDRDRTDRDDARRPAPGRSSTARRPCCRRPPTRRSTRSPRRCSRAASRSTVRRVRAACAAWRVAASRAPSSARPPRASGATRSSPSSRRPCASRRRTRSRAPCS